MPHKIRNKGLEKNMDNLKRENKELKMRLDALEEMVAKFNGDQERVHLLEKQNYELVTKLDRIENDKLYGKYIVAIQDLNRKKRLEVHLDGQDLENLQNLRKRRVMECHYLNDEYDDKMYERIAVMYNKIMSMPSNIRKMFDSQYPNLINVVISMIEMMGPVKAIVGSGIKNKNVDVFWWDS